MKESLNGFWQENSRGIPLEISEGISGAFSI